MGQVLPPVEGPIFDDDDWPEPRPGDLPAGVPDDGVLTTADLDELRAAGLPVPDEDYDHARWLAGEGESAEGLAPRATWLGSIERPQDLPPCNPGMEWVFWPVDAPFFGVPFSAADYLSRPLVYPDGWTNRQKLDWLEKRQLWAHRRERLWEDGSVECAQAEERRQSALLDAAVQPGTAPGAPPPPGQSAVAAASDVHFGHAQDLLPPASRRAARARFTHRYDWNAIADAVAAGVSEERISYVHQITLKVLRRALRRSGRFNRMIDMHRRERGVRAGARLEQVAADRLPDLIDQAIKDRDYRAVATLMRLAGQFAEQADARVRRALGSELAPDRLLLAPSGAANPALAAAASANWRISAIPQDSEKILAPLAPAATKDRLG